MTSSKRRPRAPAGLSEAGRGLWRAVVGRYDLDPAETMTLYQAAKVADLIARLDAELADADDLAVEGSEGQPRPHPHLAATAAQRRTLEHLLHALALPLPAESVGRRRTPEQAARFKGRADGAAPR